MKFADDLNPIIGNSMYLTQSDGRLVQLTSSISVSSFPLIDQLFRAKYGPPKVSRQEPWQSKGGVRTTAQLRTWIWKGLQIYLKAPAGDVDHGVLEIETTGHAAHQVKQLNETLQKGLNDL